ncbi:MAG: nitrate reductase molybdenum cofactor assembly chaperone [Rhodoferax sp.]
MALFDKTITQARSLRALAALLAYPDERLHSQLGALREVLHADRALTGPALIGLDALLDWLRDADPLAAQAHYVELFDRGRATSLHLFEHVHGDSRDRGPAMIDLAQTYEQAGLLLREGELPDHLPVALEFASTQPPTTAQAFLGEMAHILNAVLSALQARRSPYAGVLTAVLVAAGAPIAPVAVPPDVPLDASWAEPEAFGGCNSAGQNRPNAPQPVQFVNKPARAVGAATLGA